MKAIDRALNTRQFDVIVVVLAVLGYAIAWITLASTRDYGWTLAVSIGSFLIWTLRFSPSWTGDLEEPTDETEARVTRA